MASPVPAAVTETAVTTAGTSHAITLPGGGAASDEYLIVMSIGNVAATMNALTDWTELLDENLAVGLKVWVYDGAGVPGNPTFTSSANTRSATLAYLITGADKTVTPQLGTTSSGTSATPDPPASATPPSSKDYLAIAFAGMAGEEADDDTWGNTPPTNYTPSPPRQKSCGVAGTNLGGLILAAERALTTGLAENPGTFGVDVSAAWRAQTILIHPSTSTNVTPASLARTRAQGAPTVGSSVKPTGLAHTRALGAPKTNPTLTPASLVSGPGAYRAAIVAANPVLYWRFGEAAPAGAGAAQDETANNRDGNVWGPVGGQPGLIADSDTAYSFGGGDFVDRPNEAALDLGDSVTMECWYKPASVGINATLCSRGAGAYKLTVNNNALVFVYKDTGSFLAHSSVALVAGQTYHIVGVKSGSDIRIHVNGADVTVLDTVETLVDNDVSFEVGRDASSGGNFAQGILDEVALYSGALTRSQIESHFNAGSPQRLRALGSPTVSDDAFLTPAPLVHTRALGSPTANTTAAPAGLAHTRTLGTTRLLVALAPLSLVHARALGGPTIPTVAGAGGKRLLLQVG